MISPYSLLQALLEDSDPLGYIRAGAYADYYDPWTGMILDFLSPDLSLEQIERLIWDVAYANICICTIGNSEKSWVLEREQAEMILGDHSRFNKLARDIRFLILEF